HEKKLVAHFDDRTDLTGRQTRKCRPQFLPQICGCKHAHETASRPRRIGRVFAREHFERFSVEDFCAQLCSFGFGRDRNHPEAHTSSGRGREENGKKKYEIHQQEGVDSTHHPREGRVLPPRGEGGAKRGMRVYSAAFGPPPPPLSRHPLPEGEGFRGPWT